MQFAVPGVGLVEQGSKMGARWIDTVDQKTQASEAEEEDTRTAREITDGIWARMRGGESR